MATLKFYFYKHAGMKNYALLLLVILSNSCSDQSMPRETAITPIPDDNQVISTNLPGSYRWVKSVHPTTQEITTPQSVNYSEQLEISATEFQLSRNGDLVDEFPYITQRTSADENNTTYRIVNADGGREVYTFYFTNELRLFMRETCCQRLLIEYERI